MNRRRAASCSIAAVSCPRRRRGADRWPGAGGAVAHGRSAGRRTRRAADGQRRRLPAGRHRPAPRGRRRRRRTRHRCRRRRRGRSCCPWRSLTVPDGPHQLIACLDISPAAECREQAAAAIRVVTARRPPTTSTTEPLGFRRWRRPRRRRRPPRRASSPRRRHRRSRRSRRSSSARRRRSRSTRGSRPARSIPDIEVRGRRDHPGHPGPRLADAARGRPAPPPCASTSTRPAATSAPSTGRCSSSEPGRRTSSSTPDNGPIPPGLDRTEIDGALNFELPWQVVTEGETTFTAQVWSAGGAWITEEPDSANNLQVADRRVPHRREPDGVAGRPRRRRRPGPGGRRCRRRAVPLRRVRLRGPRRIPPAGLGQLPDLPGARAARPGGRRAGTVEPRSRTADVDPTAGDQAPRAEHQDGRRSPRSADCSTTPRWSAWSTRRSPPAASPGWASNGVSWTQAAGGTAAHEVAHVLGPRSRQLRR